MVLKMFSQKKDQYKFSIDARYKEIFLEAEDGAFIDKKSQDPYLPHNSIKSTKDLLFLIGKGRKALVGEGTYGKVKKVARVHMDTVINNLNIADQDEYIVKKIKYVKANTFAEKLKKAQKEADLFKKINGFAEVHAVDEQGTEKIYIIMKKLPGKKLNYFTDKKLSSEMMTREQALESNIDYTKIDANELAHIMKEAFKGLVQIHNKKIIVYDISTDNVLYDEKSKLFSYIDFGLSKYFANEWHYAESLMHKESRLFLDLLKEILLGYACTHLTSLHFKENIPFENESELFNFISSQFDSILEPIESLLIQENKLACSSSNQEEFESLIDTFSNTIDGIIKSLDVIDDKLLESIDRNQLDAIYSYSHKLSDSECKHKFMSYYTPEKKENSLYNVIFSFCSNMSSLVNIGNTKKIKPDSILTTLSPSQNEH